jgi:Ni2+-binding GTPase involved in maturation of urease and hydrogenase
MKPRPWLVLVGGFLGAGKTTLILAAARELNKRGLRSAAILNDQGEALVDTRAVSATGMQAGEVTGGCFCCRFTDLMEVADRLREHAPDVIFAEPVGSCTDLSATTIAPIRTTHLDRYRLAPLTVVVDPARARDLTDPNVSFLFRNQVDEADLVCVSKSDIHPELPAIGHPVVRRVSARTGQGVAAWLDEVLSGVLASGSRVLSIDYREYARAEASLAWMNLEAELDFAPACSPAMVVGPLMDGIDQALTRASVKIAHFKACDEASSGFVKAAMCANGDEPEVEGALDASPAVHHSLLLNLRASGSPEVVRAIVESEIAGLPIRDIRLSCFSPQLEGWL